MTVEAFLGAVGSAFISDLTGECVLLIAYGGVRRNPNSLSGTPVVDLFMETFLWDCLHVKLKKAW